MNPEVVQLLWYAGFTVLGYFLRHVGGGVIPITPILPVPGPAPAPVPPTIPADHPLLVNLSTLLAQLTKLLTSPPAK
jgi:hypothetical protein